MPDAARSFYADLVTAKGGTHNPRLIGAFRAVDRAAHLGPGPWKIFTPIGYLDTPDREEAWIHQDVVVALAPERRINKGEPSLHARCLAAIDPQPGEHVLHVGAGTDYYTAILAQLVGPAGRVDAYELEPDLAAKAVAALATQPHITVHARSALEGLPGADVIYVNAGASHPPAAWLDALNLGGRLIFPMTTQQGMGVMLLVTRIGEAAYSARVISGAMFIPCIGARDAAQSQALADALAKGGHMDVRSLRRRGEPDDTAWLHGTGWWLSSREA
jgi:protein-L-isoaspartate(D-aspartate) O-methyltransferase